MNLVDCVNNMKYKENNININEILNNIKLCKTLTEKCVIVRKYLLPQSTRFQYIVMDDLKIKKAADKTSGDGCKNNINYEIKISIHSKYSYINWVQIRPDHNIHYYVLIAYDMYNTSSKIGKAYIFKIPSLKMYDLIVKYGNYAHGTKSVLGKIKHSNVKGRNYEFAIRCRHSLKGRNKQLWNELMKYETEYSETCF